MNKIVQTMVLKFCNELKDYEIPAFRGAIIQALESKEILFHNHEADGFRYSYPLIQYKTIGNKAAIVCVDEGTKEIGGLFTCNNKTLHIGEKAIELSLESMNAFQTRVIFSEEKIHYSLRNWLPLNSKNHKEYASIESASEQIQYLEKILTANILSMAKGLNITLDRNIECTIVYCSDKKLIKHKGVKMTALNIRFKSNIILPQYIGLGKGSSHGYGVLRLYDNNKNN